MLPLLKFLDSLQPTNLSLDGWSCIYVQHVLRSNCDCASFLVSRGLERSKLRIFGKAYSTSEAALSFYRDHGFSVQSIGDAYDYRAPFDDALVTAISTEMDAQVARGTNKFLLIDEGGLAMQAAALNPAIGQLEIAITELTARGAHHYPLLESSAPIIDVARSDAKKRVEAPLIADSMVEMMVSRVQEIAKRPLRDMRVGLVGAGAIGAALAQKLREVGASVTTFDSVAHRSEATSLIQALAGADLIASSTGLGMDWSEILSSIFQPVILANCGSSDIEFRPWHLRNFFESQPGGFFHIGNSHEPWRSVITMGVEGRSKAVLLAGGFPVNFDGSADPISPEKIQLTRAILMAGALQAVASKHAGVHNLDAAVQSAILDRYNELLVC